MDQPAATWNHCLDHVALSDVGLRRANNQDAYCVVLAGSQADFDQRGHLFMVADGMGAHAAGELASKMATDAVSLIYHKRLEQSPPEAILSAVLDANHQIHSRGQASPDFRGMGTTATTLVLLPTGALVAHVGDSRAYRVRGSRIEQLTFDHSLVWEMRAVGQLPDDNTPSYISKNIITRSLGPSATVQVDLEGPFPVQAGDTFLLCSDGLSGPLQDDEIGVVLSSLPPSEAAQALIDLACLRGGPDNITVVIARVTGPQVVQDTDVAQSTSTASPNVRPVHPLVWTALGVSLLGAVGSLAIGYPLFALASFLCAIVAIVTALMQRHGGDGRRHSQADNRRFGRGPYVSCDNTPNADLLSRLVVIVRQLRDAATNENWKVDWKTFDGLLARATAADEAGDLTTAAREYLHAITSMMTQLRQQRAASSDSGIFIP